MSEFRDQHLRAADATRLCPLFAVAILAVAEAALHVVGTIAASRPIFVFRLASHGLFVLPLEGRIPVILNGIVGPSRKQVGDFGPSVSMLRMRLQDDTILFRTEGFFFDVWIELVAPAQPAALPRPSGYALCDDGPVLGSMRIDQSLEQLVFLRFPRPFDGFRDRSTSHPFRFASPGRHTFVFRFAFAPATYVRPRAPLLHRGNLGLRRAFVSRA